MVTSKFTSQLTALDYNPTDSAIRASFSQKFWSILPTTTFIYLHCFFYQLEHLEEELQLGLQPAQQSFKTVT